jgi:hypothetical protein
MSAWTYRSSDGKAASGQGFFIFSAHNVLAPLCGAIP